MWNAEILRALNVVDKNYSFRSCDGDSKLYSRMFPDSAIAKNYGQQKTKVKYVIEFGITPYIRDLVQADLSNRPFTFHFDETTTSQVKKQYDGYATYISPSKKEVTTTYCGSLFVGRCTADDMVVHFHDFMKKAGLNPKLMLSLGMDGPNVNILFENKILKELSIITLGTCCLHIASNGFGKAIRSLKESVVDLDELAIDLHFFFKYSAVRREKYMKCHEITGVVVKMMERHCTTRWLSLEKVLVKISEQWKNLTEYFLEIVPILPGFSGKNGVASTARYIRIISCLQNKNVPVVMAFVVHLAQDFRKFVKSLETSDPMIHLHPKCMQLITSILGKFLKTEAYMKKGSERGYILKSINYIAAIEVSNKENHKDSLTFGSQTETLLKILDELEKKRLKNHMKEAMVECSQYLLNKLPITEQVINDAQFLGHQKQMSKKALNAIKRLSYKVFNALELDVLKREFKLNEDDTKDFLMDQIVEEFKLYQLEDIPKSFFEATSDKKKKEKLSYWKYAYGLLDVEIDTSDSGFVRIDHYWRNVAALCNEEGAPKYRKLTTLVNCILTLSHGNADPERGFSVNKQQLDLHGNTTDEHTLEALRIVKDYLIRNGGVEDFDVTSILINKCDNAHAQYDVYLEEKRKQENRVIEMKAAAADENKKIGDLQQIERDIGLLQNGLKMTEDIIKEGNAEINELLRKKVLDRDALSKANNKVSAGCKRKDELSIEIDSLQEKRKKSV